MYLAQRAMPELEKTGGNLVAVGSVSGMRGDWGQAGYNAGVPTDEASLQPFVNRIALGGRGAGGHRAGGAVPGQRRRRVHHRRDADRGRRDGGTAASTGQPNVG